MKRAYFVHDKDDYEGVVIVAESAKEAKRIAWNEGDCCDEWIRIRARWLRDKDVSDLKIGVVNDCEGL